MQKKLNRLHIVLYSIELNTKISLFLLRRSLRAYKELSEQKLSSKILNNSRIRSWKSLSKIHV